MILLKLLQPVIHLIYFTIIFILTTGEITDETDAIPSVFPNTGHQRPGGTSAMGLLSMGRTSLMYKSPSSRSITKLDDKEKKLVKRSVSYANHYSVPGPKSLSFLKKNVSINTAAHTATKDEKDSRRNWQQRNNFTKFQENSNRGMSFNKNENDKIVRTGHTYGAVSTGDDSDTDDVVHLNVHENENKSDIHKNENKIENRHENKNEARKNVPKNENKNDHKNEQKNKSKSINCSALSSLPNILRPDSNADRKDLFNRIDENKIYNDDNDIDYHNDINSNNYDNNIDFNQNNDDNNNDNYDNNNDIENNDDNENDNNDSETENEISEMSRLSPPLSPDKYQSGETGYRIIQSTGHIKYENIEE